MKKYAIFTYLLLAGLCIGLLFWHQELKYALPTPVPEGYQLVGVDSNIELPASISIHEKPVFLHFFNPDCPCSKFNFSHFKRLVFEYGGLIDFYIVIPSVAEYPPSEKIGQYSVPVLKDSPDKHLAVSCGVYSSPQAVLISKTGQLYYRGNYNKSRYCTTPESNFAELSIKAIVNGDEPLMFNELATVSYGCELPKN